MEKTVDYGWEDNPVDVSTEVNFIWQVATLLHDVSYKDADHPLRRLTGTTETCGTTGTNETAETGVAEVSSVAVVSSPARVAVVSSPTRLKASAS